MPKINETFANAVQGKQGLESTAVWRNPRKSPRFDVLDMILGCRDIRRYLQQSITSRHGNGKHEFQNAKNPLESWAQLLAHCHLLTARSQTGKPQNAKKRKNKKTRTKKPRNADSVSASNEDSCKAGDKETQSRRRSHRGVKGEHAAKPVSTAETDDDGWTLGFV